MKKLIAGALALGFVFSFVACAPASSDDTGSQTDNYPTEMGQSVALWEEDVSGTRHYAYCLQTTEGGADVDLIESQIALNDYLYSYGEKEGLEEKISASDFDFSTDSLIIYNFFYKSNIEEIRLVKSRVEGETLCLSFEIEAERNDDKSSRNYDRKAFAIKVSKQERPTICKVEEVKNVIDGSINGASCAVPASTDVVKFEEYIHVSPSIALWEKFDAGYHRTMSIQSQEELERYVEKYGRWATEGLKESVLASDFDFATEMIVLCSVSHCSGVDEISLVKSRTEDGMLILSYEAATFMGGMPEDIRMKIFAVRVSKSAGVTHCTVDEVKNVESGAKICPGIYYKSEVKEIVSFE